MGVNDQGAASAALGRCIHCGARLDRDTDTPACCSACWRKLHDGYEPRWWERP